MAIEYENECVGCKSQGMHCLGSSCPNRDVPYYYCDECGAECDESEICEKCQEELE